MTKANKYYPLLLFILGLSAVLAQMVPYILLGEGTVVPYHDQLDGEFIAYILQAKWLFQGDVIPEFMGGAQKTALILPAPAFVLLFCTGQYFLAYVLMHLTEIIVAYVGMYLLAREVKCPPFFAVVLGGLFAYLPFLPVYGLSQFGIPLLMWYWIRVGRNRNYAGAVVYSSIFALCSSPVLVGFGVLLMMLAEFAFSLGKKKEDSLKKSLLVKLLCMGSMGILYIIVNYRLVLQMLGLGVSGDMVSHKSEYAYGETGLGEVIKQLVLTGGSHSEDYHLYILAGSVVGLLVCVAAGRKIITGAEWKALARVYGWLFLFILLAGFWDSGAAAGLRKGMGTLGSFGLARVMWIAPTLWYLSGAMILGFLGKIREAPGGRGKPGAVAAMVIFFGCMCIVGGSELWNGTYPANVCRIIGREYSSISFEEYYAVGVLEQVEDYIYETTGETAQDYRVLSLGIDPGAAYYHGFYCLDGYSNNYSLDYKHRFRKIIAPELAKNEYLRSSYDGWGNRCYLWTAQIPGYYNMEKYTSYLWDYDIDTQAAKDMGAKYILSATYLTEAEKIGLKRVREEAFETPDSYYAIYLYEFE